MNPTRGRRWGRGGPCFVPYALIAVARPTMRDGPLGPWDLQLYGLCARSCKTTRVACVQCVWRPKTERWGLGRPVFNTKMLRPMFSCVVLYLCKQKRLSRVESRVRACGTLTPYSRTAYSRSYTLYTHATCSHAHVECRVHVHVHILYMCMLHIAHVRICASMCMYF